MILGAFDGIIILGVVVGSVGLIALISFLIYRFLNPKLKSDKVELNEKDAAREELDRVLQPIEDSDIAEQVANYEENDD
jgi:hypothetical protein